MALVVVLKVIKEWLVVLVPQGKVLVVVQPLLEEVVTFQAVAVVVQGKLVLTLHQTVTEVMVAMELHLP